MFREEFLGFIFSLTNFILLDIVEYVMINSSSHQAWLFYSPLAKQAALLKDDLLDPVDQFLNDPALLELVQQCLAARFPASARTGRPGIAPDRLLRCCVMKHLKGWSFRDLERELRSNLVYRRFTRFDAEATPDFTTFSRTFALLSPEITKQIHQRVVGLAREQGVAQGRKLRTDTTVVESMFTILLTARFWATASGCSAAVSYGSPPSVRTELWRWCITGAQ
jgi:transposase